MNPVKNVISNEDRIIVKHFEMNPKSKIDTISNGVKILFVYKGRYQLRDAIIIEYLSAISKKYGYETGLVYDQDIFGITDNIISAPSLNKIFSNDNRIIKNIIEKAPQVIVFLDGFNRRQWNKEISERIKRINKSIIRVCYSSWNSSSALEFYDYVLIGEPEVAFERFFSEKIFNTDKGLYRFIGLADLDKMPLPDKKLFEPYINFKDSYLIYTSKGCPYQCSYCEESIHKNKLGNGYFRRRNPENVILELEKAKERFGIREIIYKDSVFAWDKDWLKIYLEKYKKRINLPYKCFGKAEMFDSELAHMLKESKCYCIEFGVQTFNEKLKHHILKRKERTNILMKAFSISEEYGLRYDVDHLFGIPNEKVEDYIEAAGIYKELKGINRIKCHNLVYYRESEIYEYAPQEVKDNKNYKADFFSSVSGDKDMLETNKIFQKYYKILPLLPRPLNLFILKANNWKIFKYVPYIFVMFLMILLAIKNGDRRFKVYFKHYPRKLKWAFLGI